MGCPHSKGSTLADAVILDSQSFTTSSNKSKTPSPYRKATCQRNYETCQRSYNRKTNTKMKKEEDSPLYKASTIESKEEDTLIHLSSSQKGALSSTTFLVSADATGTEFEFIESPSLSTNNQNDKQIDTNSQMDEVKDKDDKKIEDKENNHINPQVTNRHNADDDDVERNGNYSGENSKHEGRTFKHDTSDKTKHDNTACDDFDEEEANIKLMKVEEVQKLGAMSPEQKVKNFLDHSKQTPHHNESSNMDSSKGISNTSTKNYAHDGSDISTTNIGNKMAGRPNSSLTSGERQQIPSLSPMRRKRQLIQEEMKRKELNSPQSQMEIQMLSLIQNIEKEQQQKEQHKLKQQQQIFDEADDNFEGTQSCSQKPSSKQKEPLISPPRLIKQTSRITNNDISDDLSSVPMFYDAHENANKNNYDNKQTHHHNSTNIEQPIELKSPNKQKRLRRENKKELSKALLMAQRLQYLHDS
jgi:hypothetical protein